MNLAEYQRAAVRLCFDAEPAEADLQAVGNPQRWLDVYRPMVRRRLRNMAETAYTRTAQVLGEARFEASVRRFFAEHPPQSPLIREVISAFGRFALADPAVLEDTPAHTRDLLTFEHAKWEVSYLPGSAARVGEGGVRDFDFEGDAVVNPTLRVLELGHAVHKPQADGSCRADPTWLLMYRPPEVDGVRWFAVDPTSAALFRRWLDGATAVADSVRAAAAETGRAVDESLITSLSDVLTLAVQRGVIVGVR